MQNFEITFTDHIEATRRAAELLESGVTAKYAGLWDGLYIVEYQANERLPERTLPVTPEPEPEMQYINRRESDGALWPTPFQVVSAGWMQIASHPLNGRYEVGDTVLIHHRSAKPENALRRGTIAEVMPDGSLLLSDFTIEFIERCINFSKGDHLSESERESWHQEATGFQESYYESFNRNQ